MDESYTKIGAHLYSLNKHTGELNEVETCTAYITDDKCVPFVDVAGDKHCFVNTKTRLNEVHNSILIELECGQDFPKYKYKDYHHLEDLILISDVKLSKKQVLGRFIAYFSKILDKRMADYKADLDFQQVLVNEYGKETLKDEY